MLRILSLPLLILTLGLFTLIINACLLYFVGSVVSAFHVDTFWDAIWGALIISLISLALNSLTGASNLRVQVRRGPPPNRRDDGGSGPVIDV